MATPMSHGATADQLSGSTHHERLRNTQPKEDAVSVYFARKVSRHFTPLFLKTGMSANQATAVWGLLSLVNSYLIYRATAGDPWLTPVVAAVYFLVVVVDCVDGEIARYRGTASPIGGKLLDGMWHKATEYSLLIAYVAAVVERTGALWPLAIGLILVSGEAMYTFVYERRLTVIRVFAKSTEYLTPVTPQDFYQAGDRWGQFSGRQKLYAFRGLVLYKSAYFMIALSLVSNDLLLAGLVLLTLFKHYAWMKLLIQTVRKPPQLSGE